MVLSQDHFTFPIRQHLKESPAETRPRLEDRRAGLDARLVDALEEVELIDETDDQALVLLSQTGLAAGSVNGTRYRRSLCPKATSGPVSRRAANPIAARRSGPLTYVIKRNCCRDR